MGAREVKANRRVKLNLKQKIDIVADKDANIDMRIDSAFDTLDLVLKYKRENPQEFEEIFRALEQFSQKRKSDSKIDKEIESLLWGDKKDS